MPEAAQGAPDVEIRPAVADDEQAIIAVIIDAGSMFREVGMDAVAENPPLAEDIRAHIRDGHVWVAVANADGGSRALAGCVLVQVVDDEAHLEQVSTALAYAGRGIGRRLIERAEDWGRQAGYRRITLTTFTDVAWNGPYYHRLGYQTVPAGELGPELAAVRAEEARLGFDVWGRCAMARDLVTDG